MSNALTVKEATELMRDGRKIAERIWTGSRHIWLLDERPATRAIKALMRQDKLWTHYPSGGGSAGWKE